MSYKALYHHGETVDIKTKGNVGRLSLDGKHLLIGGPHHVLISLESLRSVELFRLHGTGRMLKIVHDGGTIFVSVIRFSLLGLFMLVNFYATGQLQKEIETAMRDR